MLKMDNNTAVGARALLLTIIVVAILISSQSTLSVLLETKEFSLSHIITQDGEQNGAGIYVVRYNNLQTGYMDVYHSAGSDNIFINVSNVKTISIDCEVMFQEYKSDILNGNYNYVTWLPSQNEFTLHISSTHDLTSVVLVDIQARPTWITLNGELYQEWTYSHDNFYTYIPSGLNALTVYYSGFPIISGDRQIRSILIDSGWNLISNPMAEPIDIETVLNLNGVTKVVIYDKSREAFVPFIDGYSIPSGQIMPLEAFWVYSQKPEFLPLLGEFSDIATIHVEKGWNFVGVPFPTSTSNLTCQNITKITKYAQGNFATFVNGYSEDYNMDYRRGYIIYAEENKNIRIWNGGLS